jgi:hypothetical protein
MAPSETAQLASKEKAMTDRSLDELGPVDYLVVEFPAGASNFTGEMAKELLALVDSGTIRVIDVLILIKNDDGTVEPMELSDVGELGELQALEKQLADLLAEDTTLSISPLPCSREALPECSSGRTFGLHRSHRRPDVRVAN